MKTGIIHMPTAQVHTDKQKRTQVALSDLQQSQNKPQHGDWIVTLAFYKALHAVDFYFAKKGIDHGSHDKSHWERDEQVQDYLSSIHGKYSVLYNASIMARYKDYTHNSQDVTKLVNYSLSIEQHINTLLLSP